MVRETEKERTFKRQLPGNEITNSSNNFGSVTAVTALEGYKVHEEMQKRSEMYLLKRLKLPDSPRRRIKYLELLPTGL